MLSNETSLFKVPISLMLVALIVAAGLGTAIFPYVINTWAGFFGGEPVCKWYQGTILGAIPFIGTHVMIPSLIVTWVFTWFIDEGQWASETQEKLNEQHQ